LSELSYVPLKHLNNEKRKKAQAQDDPSRKDRMLKDCHPCGNDGNVKYT
jgi:hypothetical protein